MIEHQKFIFGIIALLAVAALVLGSVQVSRNFRGKVAEKTGFVGNETLGQNTQDLIALRHKDSDNDGIPDFDELYIYKTSPYLDDTDSDKIKDKEEIDRGEDPTCPKGQVCRQLPVAPESLEVPPPEAQAQASEEAPKTLDIASLREALKKAGIPEADLNKLDDAALRRLYEETVKETQ
jgi:hypothetical protein